MQIQEILGVQSDVRTIITVWFGQQEKYQSTEVLTSSCSLLTKSGEAYYKRNVQICVACNNEDQSQIGETDSFWDSLIFLLMFVNH